MKPSSSSFFFFFLFFYKLTAAEYAEYHIELSIPAIALYHRLPSLSQRLAVDPHEQGADAHQGVHAEDEEINHDLDALARDPQQRQGKGRLAPSRRGDGQRGADESDQSLSVDVLEGHIPGVLAVSQFHDVCGERGVDKEQEPRGDQEDVIPEDLEPLPLAAVQTEA